MLACAKPLTILLTLVVATGCASRDCYRAPVCASTPATPLFDCRDTDRQPFVPDVSLVPEMKSRDQPNYCALPEQDVQCLAAMNSTLANLLVKEAEAVIELPAGWHSMEVNKYLLRDLFLLTATHQRNQDAAAAMEVFLRLVEAEAGDQSIEKQFVQIDSTLADIRRLEERGLLPPVTKSEIEGQRLDLLHRQADLQPTIHGLNVRLAELLDVELQPGSRFWPAAELVVDPTIPDFEEAMMLALTNRADLAALRRASNADGRDRRVAAQLTMQTISGGLTSPITPPRLALLHANALDNESEVRGEQIGLMLGERERATRNETAQAVMVLHARLQQIELTRKRLALAQQHVKAVEQQQELTSGATFNLRKARTAAVIVEQSLLHDTIEWKLALVKLKQAEGLLASECGYDLGACCN